MSKLKELVEKATPGPWIERFSIPNIEGVNFSFSIDARMAFSIAGGQSQEHIAEKSDAAILEGECKANARLIAKAPELAALVVELEQALEAYRTADNMLGRPIAGVIRVINQHAANVLAKVKALEESL